MSESLDNFESEPENGLGVWAFQPYSGVEIDWAGWKQGAYQTDATEGFYLSVDFTMHDVSAMAALKKGDVLWLKMERAGREPEQIAAKVTKRRKHKGRVLLTTEFDRDDCHYSIGLEIDPAASPDQPERPDA
jgi:hypothetical protein